MQLGSKVDFPPNVSDFHLITERVRQAFLQMQESVRYSRGLIFYTGFKKIGVSYHRPNRTAGTSNFNFLKLVVLFFDALTSFSSLPLHFIALVGLVLSIISFIIGSIYIVLSFFYNQYVPGWGSIMAITLFLGSTQILMIGVIGEYLARMTQELKARPKYFVEEKTS